MNNIYDDLVLRSCSGVGVGHRTRGRPRGIELDGKTIRRLRKAMGLKQIELAKRIGISHRTMVTAESSNRVSIPTGCAIARGLHVDLQQLLPTASDVREDVTPSSVAGFSTPWGLDRASSVHD